MGVTDLRPYFTQIIGHNSVNVHQIPTKRGTEIHLNEPFMYSKFQLDQSTCLHFMAYFVKCAKRKGKNSRRKNPNFGRLYLGNSWSSVLQVLNVDSPTYPALLWQIWFQTDKR